jgi:hypothetical protein
MYDVASAAAAFAVCGDNFTTEPAPHAGALTVVDVTAPPVRVTVPVAFDLPSINWVIV